MASNRLSGWDYSSSNAYHVTICTKDKLKILGTITTAGFASKTTLSVLGKAVKSAINDFANSYSDEVELVAYAIMPNHVHLLLRLLDTQRPLSSYVASFKAAATRKARALGFEGILWQRNYYDHIIRGEDDYLATIEYIENNPAKWNEDRFYRS